MGPTGLVSKLEELLHNYSFSWNGTTSVFKVFFKFYFHFRAALFIKEFFGEKVFF